MLFCCPTYPRELSCCPSCSTGEAYTHPAGVPSQFLFSRADCQGSELPNKGLTLLKPQMWWLDCSISWLLDESNPLTSWAERGLLLSAGFPEELLLLHSHTVQWQISISFTQILSEHYQVRFWLLHWIRSWTGPWLNCRLILLFPTQGTCSPLRQCCSLCGPPKSLYQLLSQSICEHHLVSFLWARAGNLTKSSCNCFLLCSELCMLVLSNLGLKHRKVLIKGK